MPQRRTRNRAPAIKLFVSPIVTGFQRFRPQPRRMIDHVTRVVQVPVTTDDASRAAHLRIQPSAWVRSLNVKGSGGNAVRNGPIDCAPEYVFAVVVHAEDEAAIDHNSQRILPIGDRFVIAPEVLPLVAARQVAGSQRLKADEDAT